MEKSEFKGVSYFEILAGLAFKIFVEKKVDYAVIETGIGGWYDATNTVERADKISIITEIGFDHMEVLGNTLAKIAFQKAMIIRPKSLVVSQEQKPEAKKVMETVAKKQRAKIFFVKPKKVQETDKGISFDLDFLGKKVDNLRLNLHGGFQSKNASVALATVLLLSQRDGFNFDQEKVREAFVKLSFPGRMEIFKLRNKTVVADGAHNPPKMDAFTKGLKKTFPNKKFNFLIAFKKGKDYENTLKYLIPLAKKIIITDFFTNNQDYVHFSEKPETINDILIKLKFTNIEIIHDCKKAIKKTLHKNEDLVVTGSLYLLGEIYPLIKSRLK
jgi:dihydrofolate synthase/folylpolyglutamate synthase